MEIIRSRSTQDIILELRAVTTTGTKKIVILGICLKTHLKKDEALNILLS